MSRNPSRFKFQPRLKKKLLLFYLLSVVFCGPLLSEKSHAATAYKLYLPYWSVCPTCVYPTIEAACKSAVEIRNLSRPYHYTHYVTSGNYCVYWWDPYRDGRQINTSYSYSTVSDSCPNGQQRVNGQCSWINSAKNIGKDSCKNLVGNPINAAFGNKIQTEEDYLAPIQDRLRVSRFYNSFSRVSPATILQWWGWNWRGFYDRAVVSTGPQQQTVYRQDGAEIVFTYNTATSVWQPDADVSSTLEQTADGWKFWNAEGEETELYSSAGRLLSITSRAGLISTLTYSDGTGGADGGYYSSDGVQSPYVLQAGLLLKVTDNFGRSLRFKYLQLNLVWQVIDPNNGIIQYAYDGATNNLSSVTYPDGKIRTYKYNESTYNGGVDSPNSLTGIVDENTKRFAYYQYDSAGRAVSTFHYANAYVGKVNLSYTVDSSAAITSTQVTDAFNTARTYSISKPLGVNKVSGISQPCSSGCGAAAAMTYDTNGNIDTKTDFNGNVTKYSYDLSRNLETSRTEAFGTPQARTITTAWHSTYRLPTLITEPGKTTAFTYDTNGNQLTKTITDTALSKPRTWTYTYNSIGQVLTADGPRTDVSDITTYTYYTVTSTGNYTMGDLATATNALGQVTQYTKYDANGRLLSMTDPNGVVTTMTYTPRGWLKTRKVNNTQTTTYDYDGVG